MNHVNFMKINLHFTEISDKDAHLERYNTVSDA